MYPSNDIGCHRTFGSIKVRSCHDMVVKHKCQMWCHILGTDKNTGHSVDKWGCMDAMQNFIQIETQSVMREVSGEVSMHRKEQREQAAQQAQNADALNENMIRMHGQNAQLALAQIRAATVHIQRLDDPELTIGYVEHQAQ